MAFTRKNYSGDAPATTLSGAITAASTSLTLASGSGYPTGNTGPFVIVLEQGTASEEKVLCSAQAGGTVTVAASGRGYDATTATAHPTGAIINHVITAIDMDEANQAVVATLGTVMATGDLLVGSGANAIGRLAVGTAGQVLTVAGGTAAWGTAGAALSVTAADITDVTNTKALGSSTTAAPSNHAHSEGMSGVLTWMSL